MMIPETLMYSMAMNSSNTWEINSANGGTLNTVLGFAAIENLLGGTLDDTFNVQANGDVGGLINGNTGADILNLTNAGNAVTVTLGGALVTVNAELIAPNNFLINNFEQVNASSTQSNTLIGANANQLWIIADLNAGAVGSAALLDAGIPAIATEGVTQFNGFGNIRGGSGDDAFRLESGSSLSSLRGGAHVNGDTIDLSRQPEVIVNISDVAATGYAELEGYRGNNTNSTLIASNASNLWTITSNNDGTVLNRTANPANWFGARSRTMVACGAASSRRRCSRSLPASANSWCKRARSSPAWTRRMARCSGSNRWKPFAA